ncbi:MAG: hypothetical protein FWD57_08340 [Polyangiaceae bacterium]|nr:hypothetical protein [Polyangiaceae bacterium]
MARCAFQYDDSMRCCSCCSGACADVFEGHQGPEAFACISQCRGDDDCHVGCLDQYPEVEARFGTWQICVAKNCSGYCEPPVNPCQFWFDDPSMQGCNACFGYRCSSECLATTAEDVNALYNCFMVSPNADEVCIEACIYDSPETVAAYAFLECLYYKCYDECY